MYTDEDLLLYVWRDGLDPATIAAIDAELARDPALRERLAALRADLARADAALERETPEPDAHFERRLWAKLEPALPAPRVPWRRRLATLFAIPAPQRLAFAAIVVAALGVGVLIGGGNGTDPAGVPPVDVALLESDAGERVLAAYLAAHLESTERALRVAANSPQDTETSRALAGSLVSTNRVYALAAERANKPQLARFLRELEPVLIELANAGEATDPEALGAEIRRRDLAFKARAAAALARADEPAIPTQSL